MIGRKIKTLVVDDSVVIRRLLQNALANDPEIEVVGAAANGRIALSMIEQLSPDIVTLDVEMPELDGLQTLKAMRAKHLRIPVIMFSTLTERGAVATVESLTLGASDYVTKPANVGSIALAQERIREQLIPKIKALCHLPSFSAACSAPAGLPVLEQSPVPRSGVKPKSNRIDAVVIGSSTGGPNALAELLPTLPSNFPVPVLIVQHMPPIFTLFLAKRLDKASNLTICEAVSGETLQSGKVWIAPGDFHLTVARGSDNNVRLWTNQEPHENSCRPSVDVLFRSVAQAYFGNVLAVVLTGMGQDGLKGCTALADAGAQIIVQDQDSSVVWGMPGYVARAGLADAILPLCEIGPEIVRRVARLQAVLTRTSGSPQGM